MAIKVDNYGAKDILVIMIDFIHLYKAHRPSKEIHVALHTMHIGKNVKMTDY